MIGKTISHYRILEKLGEGGMGVVYKAEDTKLKRTVALKFLPPELTRDQSAKTRFIHEAQAASALQHHNICTIHEIDETKDGRLFIAMDCYEGETLKEKIARGPLPIRQAVDIASQVAAGLSKAHEAGMVHRDIKPANIMVTKDGVVKLLDFGLAKLAGSTKVTRTGTTVGTAAYMSPEQATGRDLDVRSDLWSLGIVLYEMLAGAPPFRGDHEQAVIYQIVNGEPEPLTNCRGDVQAALVAVVDKSLQKDPGTRYQTAAAMVHDLVTLAGDVPVRDRTPSGTRIGRRRVVLVTIVSAMVMIAGVILLVRNLSQHPGSTSPQRKMIVVLPFENLGSPEDEYFANGITEEITSRLAVLRALGVISRTSAFHYKGTDKTVKQIAKELGVDYLLEGTVRWDRSGERGNRIRITPQLIRASDDTHLWSDRYDRVIDDIFAVQSEIADEVVRHLDIALSPNATRTAEIGMTGNLEAYKTYLRGLEADARSEVDFTSEPMQTAVRLFQRATELDPEFALAYAHLCVARCQLYHYGHDRTRECLALAKVAVDRALTLQPALPQGHIALGIYYYWGERRYDEALRAFSVGLGDLPSEADALLGMASIRRRQGKFTEAIDTMKKTMELDPRAPGIPYEMALTFAALRKYADALGLCDRSVSLSPDQSASYGLKAVIYWDGLADLRRARAVVDEMPMKVGRTELWRYRQALFERNYAEALEELSGTPVESFDKSEDSNPKSLLLAYAYELLGEPDSARASFSRARSSLEKRIGAEPEDARLHGALGLAYAGLGLKKEAIREAELAVEKLPVSKDALCGPYRIIELSQVCTMIGDYDRALELLDQALSLPTYGIGPGSLRLDPRWDPLRDHPRFQRLLEKYPVPKE